MSLDLTSLLSSDFIWVGREGEFKQTGTCQAFHCWLDEIQRKAQMSQQTLRHRKVKGPVCSWGLETLTPALNTGRVAFRLGAW